MSAPHLFAVLALAGLSFGAAPPPAESPLPGGSAKAGPSPTGPTGMSPTDAEVELAGKPAHALLGRWKDLDHGAIVEVTEKGGIYTGRIISTPLEGVKPGTSVFRRLKYDAKEKEWVGKVYSPRRDSEYNATYRVEGKKMKMKVTFGPLWKTVEWVRP